MADLSKLLAWGVENSAPKDPNVPDDAARRTELDPALVAQLFGQNVKDEATMMKEAIAAIEDPDVSIDDKETAFDNFEMLVENLDNANNIENLKLWPPLIAQLSSLESRLRFAAAWCCGTAVQNNPKSQADFLNHDGVPKLVELALEDPAENVRKKAIFALSSQVRNNEAALKVALALLPDEVMPGKQPLATDMEEIDQVMSKLRVRSAKMVSRPALEENPTNRE